MLNVEMQNKKEFLIGPQYVEIGAYESLREKLGKNFL